MLCTIEMATCISVQGELVGLLANGSAIIRDGGKFYCGRPVAGDAQRRARTEPIDARDAPRAR